MNNNLKPDSSGAAHCYAKRRVNPFRGVMQIIESEEGRALSCNGIVWEILVRASQDGADEKKTYYRFGLWSSDYGLMKRSDSPVDGQDYFELSSKCDVLIGYLRDHHEQVPFALEDDLELWLFDKHDQQPLALLSSMLVDASMPSSEPDDWVACKGPDGSASQRRYPHAEALEAQVKERAGTSINKHWIKRLAGGDGVLHKTGDPIAAKFFPVLLLDENWVDSKEQQYASDYIRWISPSLLTLQHLDRTTRERIENNLNVQAISIEHHWHLYPEVIDQKLLKAARVQSRIEGCG